MEVQMFDNLFDALADTPAEAANLRARSELLSALKTQVRSWDMSKETLTRRLGITRLRLNDLLQGRIAKFSLDALVNRHRIWTDRAYSDRRGGLILAA